MVSEHIGIASMLIKNRKLIWNAHPSRSMSIVFASLQHVKLSINIKIPVTIWQKTVSIYIKSDFMNYLIAKGKLFDTLMVFPQNDMQFYMIFKKKKK